MVLISRFSETLDRMVRIVNNAELTCAEYWGYCIQLLEEELQVGPSGEAGIPVVSVTALQSQCFDGLIVLGLVEGEFPVSHREVTWLDDEVRFALSSQLGREWPSRGGSDIRYERLLFQLLLQRARQRILFTWPETAPSGKTLAPSSFLSELQRCSSLWNNPSETRLPLIWESRPAGRMIPTPAEVISLSDLELWVFNADRDSWGQAFWAEWIAPERIERINALISIEQQRAADPPVWTIWNGTLPPLSYFSNPLLLQLSPTALETYSACPFRYLGQHIWKLATPDEALMDIDPLNEGLLIHKALEMMVRRFTDTDAGRTDWLHFLTAQNETALLELIQQIDRLFRPKLQFIAAPVWQQRIEDLQLGLERFVLRERELATTGFIPTQLECEVLLTDADWSQLDPLTPPFRIKCKIDRIDCNAAAHTFLVIDYKRSESGANNTVKRVEAGLGFQLPLYMWASLKQLPGQVSVGAVYHLFQSGKRKPGVVTQSFGPHMKTIGREELEKMMTEVQRITVERLNAIARGQFWLRPAESSDCRFGRCPFFDLCRIDLKNQLLNLSGEELD